MSGLQRRAISIATSTMGIVGLTLTGGLTVAAHYFVQEFSRPHAVLTEVDINWGLPQALPEPPASLQRSLLFKAADGTLLCGDFWAQPLPAPTVILCHGYRISRSHLRPVAELEYMHGYNVLFFDFRGHGESDSVSTSAGNAEVRDLQAAIFVAGRQPETLPGKIIIHGFSMGAAVALLTPPHPDVVAIIADSPYARSDDILRRLIAYRLTQAWQRRWSWLILHPGIWSIFAWSIMLLSALVFRVRFGYTVIARPDMTFRRRAKNALTHTPIPILLIHADGDPLIPITHARQLVSSAAANGVTVETYFVQSPGHCSAYHVDPAQYNDVIQAFLLKHLRDALPLQHRREM